MATHTFRVQGMHCGSCALLIDDTLADLPGVRNTQTSMKRARTTVDLDTATTPDDVIAELKSDMPDAVKDAALIASAQRVEHYEMAGYGCVRTYARLLGDDAAASLLDETLQEEGAADVHLTEIAEASVNDEAQMDEEAV